MLITINYQELCFDFYNYYFNYLFAAVGPNGVISGDKKIPKECFVKHCDQRRKYPVLYKLEFQVIIIFITYSEHCVIIPEIASSKIFL